MFKSDEECYIYEKKKAEFFYCAKCKNGFTVRKVYSDNSIKALVYGKDEEMIKFCPFCGFDGGRK